MNQDLSVPRLWIAGVLTGAAFVVLAVAIYPIDDDPTFLFENTGTSRVIAALGAGRCYVGWKRASAASAELGLNRRTAVGGPGRIARRWWPLPPTSPLPGRSIYAPSQSHLSGLELGTMRRKEDAGTAAIIAVLAMSLITAASGAAVYASVTKFQGEGAQAPAIATMAGVQGCQAILTVVATSEPILASRLTILPSADTAGGYSLTVGNHTALNTPWAGTVADAPFAAGSTIRAWSALPHAAFLVRDAGSNSIVTRVVAPASGADAAAPSVAVNAPAPFQSDLTLTGSATDSCSGVNTVSLILRDATTGLNASGSLWSIALDYGNATPTNTAQPSWPNGVGRDFVITYDQDSQSVSFSINGNNVDHNTNATAAVLADMMLRAKSSANTTIMINNLSLDGNALPDLTASGGDLSLRFVRASGLLQNGFTLTGTIRMNWTGPTPPTHAMSLQIWPGRLN